MIYLDCAATTKIDENVMIKTKESVMKYYGNPSSQYSLGKETRKLIENARKEIADYINAKPEEIIFTSGGTESDNLAIKGVALANPDKKHIIVSNIEHPAVLETCRFLENQGYKIDYLKADKEGLVNPKELEKLIKKDTLIVSVMHVNNEIGTIQPIKEIGKICRNKKVYFHTDAVQSFCKVKINVNEMNIDLLSVSGHKVNAPKGIGFLYVRNGVEIEPIQHGGGHERGLRSGTENTPGIIGLAEALKLKRENTKEIRDYMIKEILKIPGSRINGSLKQRVDGNINVSFYGIEGESLMLMLDSEGICVSTGSACNSHKLQHSHVLEAIGVDELYINGSIRMSFDKLSKQEADFVIEKLNEKVAKLREMSPFKLDKKSVKEAKRIEWSEH